MRIDRGLGIQAAVLRGVEHERRNWHGWRPTRTMHEDRRRYVRSDPIDRIAYDRDILVRHPIGLAARSALLPVVQSWDWTREGLCHGAVERLFASILQMLCGTSTPLSQPIRRR